MPTRKQPKRRDGTKRHRVIETLKDRIISGELAPGQRLPTRDELKASFGVGTLTLYNVFEQLGREGFTFSNRRGGTCVAECPPHLCHYGVAYEHNNTPEAQRAIERAALQIEKDKPGCSFEFFEVDVDTLDERYRHLTEAIRHRRLAGLIVRDRIAYSLRRHLARHPELPVVGLDASTPRPPIHIVHRDKRQFVAMALQELARRGVQRVGFVLSGWTGVHYEPLRKQVHSLGMTTCRAWMFYQGQTRTDGPRNCINAMMNPLLPERPDGLVVGFFEFMPAINLGLKDVGLTPEAGPVVVSHSTLPVPVKSPFTLVRMAFDDMTSLELAVDIIDRRRRGEDVPEQISYAPVVDE